MGSQVVLLVLGFILTTVLGGALGFYFQRRTWEANRRRLVRSPPYTFVVAEGEGLDR